MRVKRLETLAVERAAAGSATGRQADGDWARHLGAPIQGSGIIDDLIKARHRKVGELHLDDGPHAFDCRPDGHANHGIFTDRRVDHPSGKTLRQVFGGLESASESAYI